MFVDSHCHLAFPELAGDIDGVLARMRAAGVDRALSVCTRLDEFERIHALTLRDARIFASVGVHPDTRGAEEPTVGRLVLEDAGLTASALEVVANGSDAAMLTGPDFVKSLPMWKALDPDTLLAFEMNGEPLPALNGGPARIVAPGWTATYWIKAVADLTVSDKPFDGFWKKTAYRVPKGMFGESGFQSQDTEQNTPITSIKVNSLIVTPAPGATLSAGRRVEVMGIAWDGGSGIRKVEVSLDGGASWREAKFGRDLGRYSWRQWPDEREVFGDRSRCGRGSEHGGAGNGGEQHSRFRHRLINLLA